MMLICILRWHPNGGFLGSGRVGGRRGRRRGRRGRRRRRGGSAFRAEAGGDVMGRDVTRRSTNQERLTAASAVLLRLT